MNRMFDENGHLTPPALNALKTGSLSEIELLLAAPHIAECLCCANTSQKILDMEVFRNETKKK